MEKHLDSKILIVDDEFANIYYLNKVLSGEGYQIIKANNGFEALEKSKSENPDVLLLDIMMPEMTGIEVLEKLKSDPETQDVPVIMVTAKTDSADVENALKKGASEYIRKPIDEVELLARLRTVLSIRKYHLQLQKSLAAKEDFLKIVSHDLRTPFTTISGFAKMLKEDEEINKYYTEEHREFLDFIYSSAIFLVEYFNKLLNWAKLGEEKISLNKTEIDIKDIVEPSIIMFKSKIDQKNLLLNLKIPDTMKINADQVYLSQVTNNLIGNAIKFTPANGNISIEAKIENGRNKLIISDTGVGIPQDKITDILNNKVIKSTKGTNGEKGTGLGLKICKKILDSHSFEMSIESTESGTSFCITM